MINLKFLLLLFCLMSTYAFSDNSVIATPEQSQQLLSEVFSGPDFDKQVTERRIRLREKEDEEDLEDEIPEWFIEFVEWLESRDLEDEPEAQEADWLTLYKVVEVALWLLAIAVLLWLVYRYRYLWETLFKLPVRKSRTALPPEVLFGLDLRAESLPDDIPFEVMQLWQQGESRQALGLLYRATLSNLIHQYSFEFYDGHTERECSAIVSKREQGVLAEYVADLTSVWTRLAYAHRAPDALAVEQLCTRWRVIFMPEGTTSAGRTV